MGLPWSRHISGSCLGSCSVVTFEFLEWEEVSSVCCETFFWTSSYLRRVTLSISDNSSSATSSSWHSSSRLILDTSKDPSFIEVLLLLLLFFLWVSISLIKAIFLGSWSMEPESYIDCWSSGQIRVSLSYWETKFWRQLWQKVCPQWSSLGGLEF